MLKAIKEGKLVDAEVYCCRKFRFTAICMFLNELLGVYKNATDGGADAKVLYDKMLAADKSKKEAAAFAAGAGAGRRGGAGAGAEGASVGRTADGGVGVNNDESDPGRNNGAAVEGEAVNVNA